MKISWKASLGIGVKIFRNEPAGSKRKGTFSQNDKKVSKKYAISITFTTLQIASIIYFLGFYKNKNTKLHIFFAVPIIVKTAMEAFPFLVIYLFNYGGLYLKYVLNISS